MEGTGSTPATAQGSANSGHLQLVDGLRGLAALAVLLCHYWNFYFLPGQKVVHESWWATRPAAEFVGLFYAHGIFAVNVFWIISGFVFAYVYLGSRSDTRSFAVNRFARLYPLHLLTLLVMAGLQLASSARFGTWIFYDHNDWYHFFLNLLFVTGWGFDAHNTFNGVIWSVSVELLVYALFWSLRGWIDRRGIAAALGLAVGAGLLKLIGFDLLVLACALHFFCGTALAMAWKNLRARRGRAIGLALGLMAAGYPLMLAQHPAVAIGLGMNAFFGGLILLLAGLEDLAPRTVRQGAQWVGDTTYGTYLWHLPIMIGIILLVKDQTALMELAAHSWFLACWLVFMVCVGRLSYTCIEYPARVFVRRLLLAPRSGVSIAPVAG